MKQLRSERVRRSERGAVLVFSGLFLTLAITAGALVVDLGNARQITRQSQAAADAAVLAGAQRILVDPLDWSEVVLKVKTYAEYNFDITAASWLGCRDPDAITQLGSSVYYPDYLAHDNQCISTDDYTNPTTLRVKIPTVSVSTAFAGIMGQNTLPITRVASAKITTGKQTKCVICLLADTGTAFDMGGSGSVFKVTYVGSSTADSSIKVNSSSGASLSLKGAGVNVLAADVELVGGYSTSGAGAAVIPTPTTGSSKVSDPLVLLPVPSLPAVPVPGSNTCTGGSGSFTYGVNGASVSSSGSSTCTIVPGLYTDIDMSGSNATLIFTPGIYVIKGRVDMSGSSTKIIGNQALLYFACSGFPTACSKGQNGASLSMSGSGSDIDITPPTSGPYQGLSIFYDRNNDSGLSLNGAGSGGFTGTIYAKSAAMSIQGASTSTATQLNSMIVVNSLKIQGANSQFKIAYDKTQNAPVASSVNLSG